MPNLSSTLIGGSIYRFQFQPTPLMSSYLVAFVIGDFACIQDAFGHDVYFIFLFLFFFKYYLFYYLFLFYFYIFFFNYLFFK